MGCFRKPACPILPVKRNDLRSELTFGLFSSLTSLVQQFWCLCSLSKEREGGGERQGQKFRKVDLHFDVAIVCTVMCDKGSGQKRTQPHLYMGRRQGHPPLSTNLGSS